MLPDLEMTVPCMMDWMLLQSSWHSARYRGDALLENDRLLLLVDGSCCWLAFAEVFLGHS